MTESKANRKGIAYVLSRMEWYWNLASLLIVETDGEDDRKYESLRAQLETNILKLYTKLLLYVMKSVYLYRRSRIAVVRRDLLKLDDWGGELDDIQTAEAAVQKDIEHYNLEESKQHLKRLVTLDANLASILSIIKGQSQREDEKRQEDPMLVNFLKHCSETDPRDDKTRIEDVKSGLLADSYEWILDHEHFKTFLAEPQGQLLWIKGDPGKGKTMLLCGIINYLMQSTDGRLSYFFCQATEVRLGSATAVLRGLIYLLVLQRPSLFSHAREKYIQTEDRLFDDPNTWHSLSKIFMAMLDDPVSKDVILIIDALDECTTDRAQLLKLITSAPRARWIVSSRNWQDIKKSLGTEEQTVKLELELNPASISKAVMTYIDYKVKRLAVKKAYSEKAKAEVETYLKANAKHTFLWVALVCQELEKSPPRRIRDKLKTLPPTLDALYKQMMTQIEASEDADLCKEILALTSLAYRPVTLMEMLTLLKSVEEMEYEDLPEVIASCGSFLTVRDDVVYFVHQSANDYTLNKAASQIFPRGIPHHHNLLFSRSIDALSKTLRKDIYDLKRAGCSMDEIKVPAPNPLAPVEYSCIYWLDHLEHSGLGRNESLMDNGVIHEFFKTKFLHWLESISLLSNAPKGVLTVLALRGLVVSGRLTFPK